MTFVDKVLLQKQLVMTIGASTLVNALMFVNVKRRSRLKLHSIFTKRIICTYFPFSCSYCHKQFRRKDGLLLHMTSHTGERPRVFDRNVASVLVERDT